MGGRVAEELSGWNSPEGFIMSGFDIFHFSRSLWTTERDIRGKFGSTARDKYRKRDGQGDELTHLSSTGLGLNDTFFRLQALGLFRESWTGVSQRPGRQHEQQEA